MHHYYIESLNENTGNKRYKLPYESNIPNLELYIAQMGLSGYPTYQVVLKVTGKNHINLRGINSVKFIGFDDNEITIYIYDAFKHLSRAKTQLERIMKKLGY